MIVHPDFLDHWKTRKLVELVDNDPAAPLIMLRLWAYCQIQKASRFPQTINLAAICRSAVSTPRLLEVLIECGFVKIEETEIVVHDWERTNRLLRSAWNNGPHGGRPKTKPTGNRPVTDRFASGFAGDKSIEKNKDGLPSGYRPVTHGKPVGLLGEEEKKAEQPPDPQNVQRFGTLLKGLSDQLRTGKVSDQEICEPAIHTMPPPISAPTHPGAPETAGQE
jgi:hypothetical protein